MDGTILKGVIVIVMLALALLLIAWGTYFIIKKPELKLGYLGTKQAIQDLEKQGAKLSKEEKETLIKQGKDIEYNLPRRAVVDTLVSVYGSFFVQHNLLTLCR